MFSNTLKITIRTLWRNKLFTSINIVGFSIGIAAFILISLYNSHELSYDRFHDSSENIYLVRENVFWSGKWNDIGQTVTPLGPAISQEFAEVEKVVRVMRWFDMSLNQNGVKSIEKDVAFVDSGFFDLFNFQLIYGNSGEVFNQPNSVVLPKSVAKKYFDDENPLGKTINAQDKFDLTVTGVCEDFPDNSSIQSQILISYKTLRSPDLMGDSDVNNWGSHNNETYIRLQSGTEPSQIDNKFEALIAKYDNEKGWDKHRPHLYPLVDRHLKGDSRKIALLYAIAVFILLIACINFMNLSIAQASKRSREIGVRKVLGGTRPELVKQFVGDSMVLTLVAFLLAFFLAELLLPWFSDVCGKELNFSLFDGWAIPGFVGIFLMVGLLSGFYPAFYLSSFKPINVLKNATIGRGNRKTRLRKFLMVFQFSIAIALIISTTTVIRQHHYMQSLDTGFDRENLLYIPLDSQSIKKQVFAFKKAVLDHADVVASSVSSRAFGMISGGYWGVKTANNDESYSMMSVFSDEDLAKTLGADIDWIERESNDSPVDLNHGFLMNDVAVEKLGMNLQEDRRATLGGNIDGVVLGVFNDFHVSSFYSETQPVIITSLRKNGDGSINRYDCRYLIMRIAPDSETEVLTHLKTVWNRFDSELELRYYFFDDELRQQYQSEERLSLILGGFAFVAIVVAFLGILGLVIFTTEQRKKEISLRRVLGASTWQVVSMISGDLARLILVSILFAWIIGYVFIQNFLQNYPFKVQTGMSSFIIVGMIVMAVAMALISALTIRVASTNPATTLRNE